MLAKDVLRVPAVRQRQWLCAMSEIRILAQPVTFVIKTRSALDPHSVKVTVNRPNAGLPSGLLSLTDIELSIHVTVKCRV